MNRRPSPPHPWLAWAVRCAFAGCVAVALFAAVAGGLLRAGVDVAGSAPAAWWGAAVADHAFLMVCCFMGTVIGIERAVAVRHPAAYAAPAATALAGVLLLGGARTGALWLAAAGAWAFVAVNAAVVQRQRAPHTWVLWVAAVVWAVACLGHALGRWTGAVIPGWMCLLVLTIAAERLEMTRLMRRRPGAAAVLYGIFAALLCGAAASHPWPRAGGVVFGASLAALSVWLAVFDIARRTVRAQGLSRYMAVCLLSGYVWLLVAGLAWAAMALGLGFRDMALHALALGFVFSMVLGHAPVILPAVARVKVLFGWPFYLPLALLHLSLFWRLGGGLVHSRALAWGAAGNALALVLFAATLAGAALAWRRRSSLSPLPSTRTRHGSPHAD